MGSLGKELRANWLCSVLRITYLLYWLTPFSLQPPPCRAHDAALGKVQGAAEEVRLAARCRMKRLFLLLCVLQLLASVIAVYKQWIPNTNFETASNWDAGRVPCARDLVRFWRNKVVSVFVSSPHALTDMVRQHLAPWEGSATSHLGPTVLSHHQYLPLNGEFVLASGAGFAAFDGSWDPGCDSGATVRFADAEHHTWFDPTLWQAVSHGVVPEANRHIFSVDEERVPCQYDDVIFQPETSFRINIDSSQQVIHLHSISLMGQEFSSPEAWEEYVQGPSAPLQFHGNGTLQVTGTRCPDKSGCACGNAPDGHRICAALLRASGSQCPVPTCQNPLQPLGHCCKVCGAIINLDFTPDFDLQKYQDRLLQVLLSQPKYGSVRMAISKVHKAQTFLGVIPRSSTPLIQIVLVDDGAGAQTGTTVEQLAAGIMEDVAQHGEALGISNGKMEVSTSDTSSGQAGSHISSRITAGTIMGLLFGLLLLGGILILYRKGNLRNHQAQNLERRHCRRTLLKTPKSFTSTLCMMQARWRPDGMVSC
ncbi:protein amnionless isoform X3 [Pogoniulus pusillus]|uniref:protein amnionless isoform X3 n=1 Tax=Pogoniulus pusillus TaxID=488313 RepID=UPI0030B94F0C